MAERRGEGCPIRLLLLLALLLTLEWRWWAWPSAPVPTPPPAAPPEEPGPPPPPKEPLDVAPRATWGGRLKKKLSCSATGMGGPLAWALEPGREARWGLLGGPEVTELPNPELDTLCIRLAIDVSAGHSKCTQWNTCNTSHHQVPSWCGA